MPRTITVWAMTGTHDFRALAMYFEVSNYVGLENIYEVNIIMKTDELPNPGPNPTQEKLVKVAIGPLF